MTDLNKESAKLVKKMKLYAIHHWYDDGYGRRIDYGIVVGTINELIKYFHYVLECGYSQQYEKGCKKINMNPRSVDSLCESLYNASNNAVHSDFSGKFFEPAEITQRLFNRYMRETCDA